jgi:hypothetical protein
MSKFQLMNWANSGSNQKMEAEVMHLGQEVLLSPEFKLEELGSFNTHRENQWMDKVFATAVPTGSAPFSGNGW